VTDAADHEGSIFISGNAAGQRGFDGVLSFGSFVLSGSAAFDIGATFEIGATFVRLK